MGTTRALGWVVGMAVLAACAETTGGTTLDPESFTVARLEALCRVGARCPHAHYQDSADLYGDPAACVAYGRATQGPWYRDQQARVRAGSIRFDPAAARRCLDTIGTSCAGAGWAACADVFVGRAAEGQSCETGDECAPGTYCDFGDDAAPACPGRCLATHTPPGQVGRPWASCRPDPGATAYITNGLCQSLRFGPAAALDEPCGLLDQGDGRLLNVDCAAGLACNNARGSSLARCVRPLAAGAACVEGDVCVAGFGCAIEAAGAGHCGHPPDLTRVVGGPCTPNQSAGGRLPSCDPLLRLTCDETGHCVSVGDGSEGSGCVHGVLTNGLCNEGLYCDTYSADTSRELGVCRVPREDGAACTQDLECRAGACRGRVCGTPRCW